MLKCVIIITSDWLASDVALYKFVFDWLIFLYLIMYMMYDAWSAAAIAAVAGDRFIFLSL